MINPLVAVPGGWELVLIVLVILLLFGAKKLPELARGSGRALRIFKSETRGLMDDDDDDDEAAAKTPTTPVAPELEAREIEAERLSDPGSEPIVREQRDGTIS